MVADLVLTDAKAYLKGEIIECCFAIDEGKILKIGKEPSMPAADEKTSLHNMLILPGVIDTHVHLRDEEKAYKETFLTGTAAAAAGGVTTVLDMPNNTPVTMSVPALRNRMQIAQRRILVNVGFHSAFPASIDDMQAIVAEGATGFKLFMSEQVGGLDIDNDEALKTGLKRAGELGVPVAVHAEDHLLLKKATDEFKLNHKDNINAFLKTHDESVELTAVERLLSLAAQTEKSRLHFCHVSTEKALAAVSEAKKSGRAITCEITPHHLNLNNVDFGRYGAMVLTMPPLRTKENVDALWKGLMEGTVDTVGSDHAPHTLEEKEGTSIWDVKAGIPGLETILPLILTAVHKGSLTLSRAVELLSENPAEIFGLTAKGKLRHGDAADLVVVDFNCKYRIDASKFKSKAKFSPFDKWDVQGKPLKTYVGGHLVAEEGEIVAKPGTGSLVRGAPQ
jgi:dihydroorotase (multifunctional complex type)